MPTTSVRRLIAAPVADVWRAITDLEGAARWNGAWQRVEYLSSQREGIGTEFRAHTEDGLAHDFTISQWAPMEYVAFSPQEQEQREKGYLITLDSQAFHLQPAGDDHTSVTLLASATGHGLRGWVTARFVWPGYQRQGLDSALDALQAFFEPPDEEAAEPDEGIESEGEEQPE